MNTAKNTCFWMTCGFIFMTAFNAHAATVNYTLDNVILDDNNTQMTGTFSWTFDIGDFENGDGIFISLAIPFTWHDHNDLDAVFDIGNSIEITLAGSVHDDGVDITLFLSEPLTPTTSSSIDLLRSKYEIGGNGFHDGLFLSGSISPILVPGDTDFDCDVDFTDFNNLANNYTGGLDPGTGGKVWGDGDFDIDGDVDFEDFNDLANNYTGAGEGCKGVPEPCTLILLGIGALGITVGWRRR